MFTVKDMVKIFSCNRFIQYNEGAANHYFLLMVYGVPSNRAYKIAYNTKNDGGIY